MTAIELFEQVKDLPTSEQTTFVELLHKWEAGDNGVATNRPEATIEWPDFMARLKKNFPKGIPPGPPASLLLHEGRGEY